MTKTYRQGDVLLLQVSAPRAELKEVPREAGRIVLAHGEVTGHSHAIASKSARLAINEQTLERFLRAKAPAVLEHEEHARVRLPPGNFEVRIQREYDPTTQSRAVVD